jgi:hypothetical protein
MTPRQLILRHFVALGGIALALMALLQESHALCAIVNCMAKCHGGCDDDLHAQKTASKCACCCHKTAELARDRGVVPPMPADDYDPCGPACYCSQPCPWDVPRNVSQSLQSRLTTLLIACLPMQWGIELVIPAEYFYAGPSRQSLAQSSRSTCALLCRFLT